VSAAFVRLSQEAATSRYFPAMEQALDLVAGPSSRKRAGNRAQPAIENGESRSACRSLSRKR